MVLEMIGSARIDLDALRTNARALARMVAPAKAAFVVKSNAYGHGLIEVARAVEPVAYRLCVFSFDEAAQLRAAGIAAPIFVMGPVEPVILDEVLAANVEIPLWDTGTFLREVAAAAAKRSRRFPVHVKINTGLGRLGLEPRDAPDVIEDYARTAGITVAGIFSHLAAAEELDSPFTQSQVTQFEKIIAQTQPALARKDQLPIRHIAASAAAMLWPHTRLDMVRLGIALYGLWPSPQTRAAMNGSAELLPALSLESKVVAVRELESGAALGYGRTYRAPKKTRIGVVPMGYAEGIPRLLSNRGVFLVDGAPCPIVGRVAMNMTTIDLSAAPNAHAGSRVVLIGEDHGRAVTADDWASWSQTINYEIVTRLASHIPRVFESL